MNTSPNGTVLTEYMLNISRLHTPKRTRKIPSLLGRMKRKKEKKRAFRKGTSTTCGKLKLRSSWTQKNPLMVGKPAGTEKKLWRIKGEHSNGLWKAGQSKNCLHGLCHSTAWVICLLLLQRRRVPGKRQWCWVLESRVQNADPGSTVACCEKTARKDRNKEFHSQESLEKQPRTPQKQHTGRVVHKGWAVIAIPFFTHGFCLLRQWEGHPAGQPYPPLKPKPPSPTQTPVSWEPPRAKLPLESALVPLPEMGLHQCWWGWVLKCECWRVNPGKGNSWLYRYNWRNRTEASHGQERHWRKRGLPRKPCTLAQWRTRGRTTTDSTIPDPASLGTGKDSQQSKSTPVCQNFTHKRVMVTIPLLA